MQKFLTLSIIAAVATANSVTTVASDVAAWPQVNLYTTFSTSASIYTWDGTTLTALKDLTADVKVDSERNKIRADAKVKIPVFGKVSAQVVVDLTNGFAIEHIPLLGICQHTALNATLNLKETLDLIYSPTAGVTQYDGESQAPWDPTNMWKFTSSAPFNGTTLALDSYFDEAAHNGKWIAFAAKNLVVKIPNGEQPATFTDQDFVLTGCNEIIFDPARKVPLFFE